MRLISINIFLERSANEQNFEMIAANDPVANIGGTATINTIIFCLLQEIIFIALNQPALMPEYNTALL